MSKESEPKTLPGSVDIHRRDLLRVAAVGTIAGATLGVAHADPSDNKNWLLEEPILDKDLPIVDAHGHLVAPDYRYLLEDNVANMNSGHNNIGASVCVEARAMRRSYGPKPVGETEFFGGMASMSASRKYGRTCMVQEIVSFANLTHGTGVQAVLEAHLRAGNGRVRDIRHMTTYSDESRRPACTATGDVLMDKQFREGFSQLAPLGLSFHAYFIRSMSNSHCWRDVSGHDDRCGPSGRSAESGSVRWLPGRSAQTVDA